MILHTVISNYSQNNLENYNRICKFIETAQPLYTNGQLDAHLELKYFYEELLDPKKQHLYLKK